MYDSGENLHHGQAGALSGSEGPRKQRQGEPKPRLFYQQGGQNIK